MDVPSVLTHLYSIKTGFEGLKSKNQFEPSPELHSLYEQCNTLATEMPLSLELQLSTNDQFKQIAKEICQLSYEFEMNEELLASQNNEFENVKKRYKNVIHFELTLLDVVMPTKASIEKIVFIMIYPSPTSL
jgi:hypothetical protein